MKHRHTLTLIIACLWCWAPLASLRAVPLHVFLGGSPSAPSSFTVHTAVFDGSNDYLRRGSQLNGVTDGKTSTVSFWINMDAGDGSSGPIFRIALGADDRFIVARGDSNTIRIIGDSPGGTTMLDITGSTPITAAGTGWGGSGWYHIFICINTTSEAATKIYVNGVPETVTYTTLDGSLALDLAPTSARITIGANSQSTATNHLNGALAEFVYFDTYHDIPASFYSGTSPADIGATGSVPTGAAPDIYLSRVGGGNSWVSDSSGNGNDFVATGTIETTTPP